MITYLAAFALLVATTAFAQEAVAKPCKGGVVSTVEAQELIARACGEGHKCEVHGDITRAREIKRVFWATGPKGMSFKVKQCPSCIEALEKVLNGEQK